MPLHRAAPGRGRPGGAVDAARAAARRGGSCASSGPTPCSAPAATWPARSGWPRSRRRIPLVLTEADSHLGLTNRMLAPFARRVCLAFPIDGPRRAALPRHRPAGAATGDRPRRGPRAVRDRARGDVRARVRRLARRALDQPRRDRGVRRAPASTSCTPPASATCPTSQSPGPALRPARLHRRLRRGAARERPRRRPRRRLGVRDRRPRPPGRADPLSRTRPPTTRPRTPRYMERAGAAVVIPDAELTAARLGAEVGSLLADREPPGRDGSRRRRAGPARRRARDRGGDPGGGAGGVGAGRGAGLG